MMDKCKAVFTAVAGCLPLLPGLSIAQPTSGWQPLKEPTPAISPGPQWETPRPEPTAQTPEASKGVVWKPLPSTENNSERGPSWKKEADPSTPQKIAQPEEAAPHSPPLPPYTWPNGQPMSPEDRRFFSTAFSRGSLIQIGETIYPNLGFNALQRHPSSWVSLGISAIDTSRQSQQCTSISTKLNFFDDCADALFESYWRILNTQQASLDLQWTVHSLSGSGSPFPIAGRTGGTAFGEGQSLGFKLSSNINPKLGITIGANRLVHLDQTTDLPKNIYVMGTKVFALNKTSSPPILSVSAGIMSDVFNPNTNLGSVQYPKWLLGGIYPSIFAQAFDPQAPNQPRGYYPNVAGATSAYVCAQQSIYQGKGLSAASPDCIKQVSIGPVGSIGFAPWPWIGIYAKYTSNITLGASIKPLKQIPWTISLEAIAPIEGINPIQDRSLSKFDCNGERAYSFSRCRTRYGLFTQLTF